MGQKGGDEGGAPRPLNTLGYFLLWHARGSCCAEGDVPENHPQACRMATKP